MVTWNMTSFFDGIKHGDDLGLHFSQKHWSLGGQAHDVFKEFVAGDPRCFSIVGWNLREEYIPSCTPEIPLWEYIRIFTSGLKRSTSSQMNAFPVLH